MATSQLLAGAILVDGNQALLLNGVEAYCRYPSVDVHHENLTTTQESSVPELTSQYPNELKITKINVDKSEKLILGSRTMNVLVVSSIRIDDAKLAPEVGPSTSNFSPSKNTQIFLASSSIKLANKILDDPSSLTLCDPVSNLRQLRSKYLQPSTYALARFFSVFTPDITVQPYTVYTLVNSTSNNNTSCMMGSKAMEHIALSVLEGNGKLKKEEIEELLVNSQGKETQVSSGAL